ncbi:MAG TPA: GGDEF domain-containing protein [Anaerolineales bacterium]|nr:GGDEF domain-containing protein [Anaerolineales bacterium]
MNETETVALRPKYEEFIDVVMRVTNQVTAMLAYWNIDRVCLFANAAYRDWFGKSGSEVMGMTMQELLGPLYEQNLPYIEAAMKGERQVFEREIPTPTGEVRYSIATYIPDIVNGKVNGMIVLVSDVTPLKKLEHELQAAKEKAEQLAAHDFLTGLPNRVLLADRISQAISRAKREKKIVTVMTIDLDNFKKINDTYGHAEGDRLLVEIASRMKHSIRESDTIARYGGDEFILACIPEVTTRDGIEIILKRLQENVNQPFHILDDVVIPSFSIGIALYPINGTTMEELISKSDKAMYKAKKLGKNRFAFVE